MYTYLTIYLAYISLDPLDPTIKVILCTAQTLPIIIITSISINIIVIITSISINIIVIITIIAISIISIIAIYSNHRYNKNHNLI